MHGQELGSTFRASLPVAGRTGTLDKRMRGTRAQDNCQAKTGTLLGVSALAGYCTATNGHTIAFGFMMTGTTWARARGVQDRMTVALARYGTPPAATTEPVDPPSDPAPPADDTGAVAAAASARATDRLDDMARSIRSVGLTVGA